MKTDYSHAFLVGSFNGDIAPEQLDANIWKKEIISLNGEEKRYERDKGYNGLCTLYYKAHLDAMLEGCGIDRPDFLQSVHHYIHDLTVLKCEDETYNRITLPLNKGKYPNLIPFEYKFTLCRLHLFFFPLSIVLFAIEIDDTGNELDNLTAAHFSLMGFWDADSFGNQKLLKAMRPLTEKLSKSSAGKLAKDGNKLKIFQTIRIDFDRIDDDLLYELATSSPIGCVKKGNRPDLKPSESYFKMIMDNNTISTFDNWKGLALVDSFTMLGKKDSFYENDCNFLYFPLIYMRSLFEKTFCFSRNNAYREDKADLESLPWEIEQMEKYYFYENISYNFQPNLIYKAMAKGLGIKEEREELARQVKESAKKEAEEKKDAESKKFDHILSYAAIFAVFSVVWDLFSLLNVVLGNDREGNPIMACSFFVAAILIIVALQYMINKNMQFTELFKKLFKNNEPN